MELTINDKTYKTSFGIGFVFKLNAGAGVSVNGVAMGMGLNKSLIGLRQYDPTVLSNVLYYAMVANGSHPTQKQLNDYLESDADLEKLFDETIKEMSESNVIKPALKNLKA